MIIGASEQIFDGEAFAAGVARALRGVVRVTFGPQEGSAVCTGWMLTPRLVVVPAYAVAPPAGATPRPGDSICVLGMKNGKVAWQEEVTAEPEFLSSALPDSPESGIALLRLRTPRPNRELTLGFDAKQPGSFLSLLHFPYYGRPVVCISFGRLSLVEEPLLAYDADTLPGSGGAPVFDERWQLVAMHLLADGQLNRGLSLAALVETLQRSSAWPEIARSHRLADVAAGRQELQVE